MGRKMVSGCRVERERLMGREVTRCETLNVLFFFPFTVYEKKENMRFKNFYLTISLFIPHDDKKNSIT